MSSKNAFRCHLVASKHRSWICDYNCDKQSRADAIGIAKCDQKSLYCFFYLPLRFAIINLHLPTNQLLKAKNENQFFKCVHLNVNFVDSLNMNEYWSTIESLAELKMCVLFEIYISKTSYISHTKCWWKKKATTKHLSQFTLKTCWIEKKWENYQRHFLSAIMKRDKIEESKHCSCRDLTFIRRNRARPQNEKRSALHRKK